MKISDVKISIQKAPAYSGSENNDYQLQVLVTCDDEKFLARVSRSVHNELSASDKHEHEEAVPG